MIYSYSSGIHIAKGGIMAKILVIDDYPTIRRIITCFLDREHEVIAVSNGDEAVRMFQTKCFDLLIADVEIPDAMSGVMAGRILKDQFPSLKVIMMSGYPLSLEEYPFADNVITKPFRQTELALLVRTTLGG
ncbi:MAG: response regulator [Candidatus Magasanikbacteria bacterium]